MQVWGFFLCSESASAEGSGRCAVCGSPASYQPSVQLHGFTQAIWRESPERSAHLILWQREQSKDGDL